MSRPAAGPWRVRLQRLGDGRCAAPLLALAGGAVQPLAYTHTRLWPLPLLALALLVARLDGSASRRRAELLGWCYGTAWLVAGVWWLYISMHHYGGLPALLSALAVGLLCGFLSLYLAAAAAAYAHGRCGRGSDALRFGALFLLAELARGVLFTGFPWVAAGYSQVDSPLAALAPWVGVYGIGAWMATAAAALVLLLRRRAWVPAALAAALALAAASLPDRFTVPAGDFSVALLQTDVKQNEKFDLDHMAETLAWVAQHLVEARAELAVAPETAVPLLPAQLDEFAPGYWQALRQRFAAGGRAALVGVPLGDFDHGYTNSVAGLSAGPPYRYDKRHLVPFGEFIPWGFRWFTDLMHIPLGDFERGVANPPSFAVLGQRLAPNICYEDLFGEALARRFADPATAPTAFVNIGNIAWFGDTEAIPQHLNISRLRALEFQRPMLRSTNTGATAIIDYRGRVTAEMAPYTRGVLRGRVQGRNGITPYAWWAARAGLWPLGLGALAVLAVLDARRRLARGPGRPPAA